MLTILHTNDLHNNLGLLPRLTALIARERARAGHTLLLDAGDLGLTSPTADLGVALLAALDYDALTPGNAETGLAEHRRHLGRVGAPVVVANLATPGALGYDAVPALIRTAGNVRVAVLGLTPPPVYPAGHPLHRRNAQEIPVEDAFAAARSWVPRLREEADFVLVVSHLGLWRDVELARIPGIDLIIGGHSHHRLPALLRVGETPIAQGGIGGTFLGVIEVTSVAGGWRCEGRLEPVWQEIAPDEPTERTIAAFLRRHLPEALEPLGETTGCWADPWTENPWANRVTDHLRAAAGTDVFLYNASGLFPALDPGVATRWDLWRAVPSLPLNRVMDLDDIVAMTVSGADLRAICEHSVTDLPADIAAQAPASASVLWPGSTFLQVSGLRMGADLRRPKGDRLTTLTVAGEEVDPDRRYTVATTGFLARGYSGYRWLAGGTERRHVGSEENLLRAAIGDPRPLPDRDGRLQITGI